MDSTEMKKTEIDGNDASGMETMLDHIKTSAPWDYFVVSNVDFNDPRFDISNYKFDDRILNKCKFTNCNMNGIEFTATRFNNVQFVNCTVNDADLSDCVFAQVTFEASKFIETDMSCVKLQKPMFTGSDFMGSDFTSSVINNGDFNSTSFDKCHWRDVKVVNSSNYASEMGSAASNPDDEDDDDVSVEETGELTITIDEVEYIPLESNGMYILQSQ